MKQGKVLIVGRPNVGKSTFLNNLIGQKVSITSPKPQTTRFPVRAFFQDERGTITFIDTPGIAKAIGGSLSKKVNEKTYQALNEEVDVVLYMIDQSRRRDFEEAKVLGIVRKIDKPKILVINKIDKEETYLPQYEYLKEEFSDVFAISALKKQHIKPLIDRVFALLPESKTGKAEEYTYPLLNMDSTMFIAELIREKVFLMMGEEIPYTTTVIIDHLAPRPGNVTYIKARILTTNDRYKKMLIGSAGRKIKEIGSYARKEIELATDKKIYLDLSVVTDPHWQETYYS